MNAGAAVHIGVGMNVILLIAWALFATATTENTTEAPAQRAIAVVTPEALATSTLTERAELAWRTWWQRFTRLAPETPLPHP